MMSKLFLPHFGSKQLFPFFLAVLTCTAFACGVSYAQPASNKKFKTGATTQKTIAANPPAKTAAKPKQTEKGQSLIVTAFNVNVRELPSTTAAETGRLKFGTVVRGVERSATQDTIGGKQGYWHKIAPVGGKGGWVFGAFLKPFDAAKREAVYKQIAAEKNKTAKRSFSENAEFYEFLTRAQGEIKTPETAAEIGLWRFLALKAALAEIPFDGLQKPPYKDFTDKHTINIVYSEPSGQWYVRSDRFWSLAKKYQNLPIGERIAWEAAKNPLPGECEGYLNCYLFLMRVTQGEYLERYPKGANAADALKELGEFLQPIADDAQKKEIYETPVDVSDRAEFYKNIAELRTIVSRTGFFEKEAVLRQLDKIAGGYR